MISKQVKQFIKLTLKKYFPPYVIVEKKPWRGNKVYLVFPKQNGMCLGAPPLFFEKDGVIFEIGSHTKTYEEWKATRED